MYDLENLLNLDGETFPMDNGYWVKFEVQKIKASKKRSMEPKKRLMTISTSRWILCLMSLKPLHNL